MASILHKTEAERGFSALGNTRGQKLTLFCLGLICLDSRTEAE